MRDSEVAGRASEAAERAAGGRGGGGGRVGVGRVANEEKEE